METIEKFEDIRRKDGFLFVPNFIKFLHNRPQRKVDDFLSSGIAFSLSFMITAIISIFKPMTRNISSLFLISIISLTIILVIFYTIIKSHRELNYNEKCEIEMENLIIKIYSIIIVHPDQIVFENNNLLKTYCNRIAGILYCELNCLDFIDYIFAFKNFLEDMCDKNYQISYDFNLSYDEIQEFIYREVSKDIDLLSSPSEKERLNAGASYSKILEYNDLRYYIIYNLCFNRNQICVLNDYFEQDPHTPIVFNKKFRKKLAKIRNKEIKRVNKENHKYSNKWWRLDNY